MNIHKEVLDSAVAIEQLLKSLGYAGNGIGESIKLAGDAIPKELNSKLWRFTKIRNTFVHQGDLTVSELEFVDLARDCRTGLEALRVQPAELLSGSHDDIARLFRAIEDQLRELGFGGGDIGARLHEAGRLNSRNHCPGLWEMAKVQTSFKRSGELIMSYPELVRLYRDCRSELLTFICEVESRRPVGFKSAFLSSFPDKDELIDSSLSFAKKLLIAAIFKK